MNPNKRLRLAQEKADAADKTYDNAHYQQAVDLWLESAELSKNLKGNELHYAACLGNALNKLGNYNRAKKLIEIALPIQKKIFGSNDSEVAKILNNLAGIYYKKGEYEKAKELHEKVLIIWEKMLPSDHPSITTNQVNSGQYSVSVTIAVTTANAPAPDPQQTLIFEPSLQGTTGETITL